MKERKLAELDIEINGRTYRVACEDGEEDRLIQLSEHLNQHAVNLASSVGSVGETKLMLMAALLIGDELIEALDIVDELKEEIENLNQDNDEIFLHETLSKAAQRIEELAGRVKTA